MSGPSQMVSLRLTEEEILELDRRIGFDGMRNRSDVLRRGLHKLLEETASPDSGRRITIRVGTIVAQQLQVLERMAEIDASSAAGLGIALLLEQKSAEMRASLDAGIELLEEVGSLHQLWIPVGGGGLAAGTTIVANGQIDVICAEPELARDAHDSLRTGRLQSAMPPSTVADGLRTALGQLNFEILRQHKVAVVLVDDEAILAAMRLIWNRLKIVVEPSASVCLAAMLRDPKRVAARAGIVLSGGNVSPPGLQSGRC